MISKTKILKVAVVILARLSENRTFVSYFNKFKLLVKNNDKQALAKFLENSYSTLTIGLEKKGGKQ